MESLLGGRQSLVQAASMSAGEALLASASKEKGAVTTDSGLVYQELLAGEGESPGPQSKVAAQALRERPQSPDYHEYPTATYAFHTIPLCLCTCSHCDVKSAARPWHTLHR